MDLDDEQSLSQLSRTLGLINVLQGLVVTNKQLKGLWAPRSINILRLVRDLLLPVQGILICAVDSIISHLCRRIAKCPPDTLQEAGVRHPTGYS